MIPVSLVVVVVGGWTAVYLTDLVLKVRASGPRYPGLGRTTRGFFSSTSRFPVCKPRGGCPRAAFRVVPGPVEYILAGRGRGVAGCAAAAVALRGGTPQPSGAALEAMVVVLGGPGHCLNQRQCPSVENVRIGKALLPPIVF